VELQREHEAKEAAREQLKQVRMQQEAAAAEAELAEHVEAEEAGEEVEELVRELRMEAQESALRQMEGVIHKLHITSIKADTAYNAQVAADEERFMRAVEALQEDVVEEEERRRLDEGQERHEAGAPHLPLPRPLHPAAPPPRTLPSRRPAAPPRPAGGG